MNNNNEPNTGVFPFIQDTFIAGKKDKEYILKISSNDTLLKYPFDFQVKFAMDIIDSSNNFKKEAIIYNKYTDITYIEVSDVIIPRFIPTSTIGRNIEGFRLIKTGNNKFIISCYPGCNIKTGTTIINTTSYNFIKLISPKEYLFMIKRGIAHNYSVLINDPILEDDLVIDHLNYNNNILPILDISNNEITVNNYNITLPNTIPIIIADSNILFKTSTATANATTLTIPNLPLELVKNIYADNIIRIIDASQNNYYFKISSYTFNVEVINTQDESLEYTSSSVTPNGIPSAPTNLIGTVANSNTQVILSWDAPASNGSTITSYNVISSPAGGTVTINFAAKTATVTVTNLNNGIVYTFTVTATNSAGTSVASNSIQVSYDIIFKGNWSDLSYGFEGVSNLYLFGFGSKDLLDERIFYIELESFKPSTSTSTNNQFDKMFGVLFPSTQSTNWLYLSGEPKQTFVPTDSRKMDKLTIRLYDSKGNNLNDIFYKKLGLLNTDYNSNLFSSLLIKIQEQSKSLHITN